MSSIDYTTSLETLAGKYKMYSTNTKNINIEQINLNIIRNAINDGYLNDKAMSLVYDDWRDVGFIIKHTSQSEEAFLLFDQFSQINENKYDASYTKQFWNTIKQTTQKPLTIVTLKKWVNDAKNKNKIVIFCSNDAEAVNILFEELKDKLKACKGRIFYYHNNIWVHEERLIYDIMLTYILHSNIYSSINNKSTKLISYAQNVSKAKNIYEALCCKIRIYNEDDDLYNKFHHTTKGKLCFNDGVLDFRNKTFVVWENIEENTIYSTTKINRNYQEYFYNPDFNVINEIKSSIFETSYGDNTNLALQFLARAIAGHHEDKRWATYLGNRNSGKGVEYDLLQAAFEKYVSTFELGNLLYSKKLAGMETIDCSKKLYWLIDLEFVRLAISQEIPDCNSGLLVNGKIIKKITGGGDTIVARRNYDKNDTHFNIDTTFYIKGNNTLECDSVDCNETRLEFNSVIQFKTIEEIDFMKTQNINDFDSKRYKIADPNIKNKCKQLDWINAVIFLIYLNYSDTCVNIKKDINYEECTLLNCLEETFEFTYNNNDIIPCSDVNTILNSFDKGKIVLELKNKNIIKKKCNIRCLFKDKWCFFGLKLKK